MPELPDVEGFRRVLAGHAGRKIDRVDVLDAGVLRGVGSHRLADTTSGYVFGTPRRHGKLLIGPLRSSGRRHRSPEPSLVLHFGMTGLLLSVSADESHGNGTTGLRL